MESKNKPEAEIRLAKLTALKDQGVNPYPNVTPIYKTTAHTKTLEDGARAATVGRITSIRGHGKSMFIDLVDNSEKIQLFCSLIELGEKEYRTLELLDIGDYLWVDGELFTTNSGEKTIKVQKYQLLSKSLLPIPDSWHGLTDIEARYRQRALDFKINPTAYQIIQTRSKVIQGIRHFLERHGFIEIQTPVLQPMSGGAAAKPFITHHNALDTDFYLRIATELYLKRLVVGGFERVYEIGPDFRNEGLSHMHNPEFTMCEFYWAYQSYDGLMKVTQQLMQELVRSVHGKLTFSYNDIELNFSKDFAIRQYVDVIKEDSGIDILEQDTLEKLTRVVKEQGIELEKDAFSAWSKLVDELFKKVSRPKIVQPTFVIDYPIELQPLAKKHRDNPKLAEQFQLIMGSGLELVKAYSELNDPLDQEERFKEQVKLREGGWDEAQQLDDNYIEALKYGMPPTAGWGMGIERMVMVLANQRSIKEVIPFPTLRPVEKSSERS